MLYPVDVTTATDAEMAFYERVLTDPAGKSLSDLRYAFYLATTGRARSDGYSVDDLRRAYYLDVLSLPVDTKLSTTDLERLFYGETLTGASSLSINDLRLAYFSSMVAGEATNLFTNPSFEDAGSPVEVWRNLYRYANAETGATTGWAGLTSATISSSTDYAHSGTRSYKVECPGGAVNEGIAASPSTNSVSSGAASAETHSVWVRVPLGATMRLLLEEYTTASVWVANRGEIFFTGTGDWQQLSISGTKGTAGNVLRVFVGTRATAQAITFYVDDLSGTATPVRVWDPTDPDLTLSFVGTANASESILTGISVPGVTAFNCVAIRSSQWAKEGTYSLRLIPTTTNNATYALFTIPSTGTLRAGGTIVATCRLAAPQTGGLSAGRARINAQSPLQSSPNAPNVAGETELRLHYSNLTDIYQGVLTNGASISNGDVWWDIVTLVEGTYDGPAFSGSTPDEGLWEYDWSSTIDASASTRTLAKVDA